MPKIPKLAGDPAQLNRYEAGRAIEERKERAGELLARNDDDLSASEADELRQLNDELEALEQHHTPDPAHAMRHAGSRGSSSRGDGAEFGRVEGLGRSFIDELGRQNGGNLQAAFDGTSGGATLPMPFFDPKLRDLPQRALFIRSLIPTMQAASDKVDYIRQTVFTNNAAPVAAGGVKPTSTITVERVETPIRVIAHISEGVDRMLLADYDQAANFIDNQLRLGVLLSEENQILNGNGTPPNLTGILNTSGIQTQAKGADPVPDAIYKAITLIRQVFAEPDAVVMHPLDWQDVATLRATDGTYLWGQPSTEAEPRIWGKRVVVSPVIAQNTALVGAFGVGTEVYEREGARVSFTESGISDTAGQDLFSRNQIRFRGESRIGLAVVRPNFFCTVTGV